MKIIYFPISGLVLVAHWDIFSKMRKEDYSMRVIYHKSVWDSQENKGIFLGRQRKSIQAEE